jgi:diguanylate cyclase (GGDEF)-like protein
MQSAAAPASSPSVERLRVLVLSRSDRDARLLLKRIEAGVPSVVHERVDNPEALKQALLASDWDLVLSQCGLHGLSARVALGILKTAGRDIPLVTVSGAGATGAAGQRRGGRKGSAEIPKRPVIAAQRLSAGQRDRARPSRSVLSTIADGGGDATTQLAPRARFLELAPRALAACGTGDQAVLCFIDFASFGIVNAAFGFATGDAVLQQIGARLNEYARLGFAAYFGGDEFVVLQGGFDDEDTIHRYVHELSAVVAQSYSVGDLKLHIASDVGVSAYPSGGKSLSELVLNAQTALHQCKRLMGRDAYIFYFPELNPAGGENVLLDSALSQALKRSELRLYYQPCVSLSTGRVTSVEALVRWQHPELGLLASERFIALATECGLIGEIDSWVLREAGRQACVWRRQGNDFTVAVNISPSEFANPRLLGRAATALSELGMESHALEIEITELALLQDTATSIATLQALRNMGVRIAIDDFGTGYSSLASLKRFPVDILKIDKSFVKNIARDAGDAAIAQTIIALARNLGLTVQAEGVETREQLELLASYGCDRAQGHFFARPVPGAEVLPLVRRLQAEAARAAV